MSEPTIRQQLQVAADVVDEAARWERDAIDLAEFHAAIERAAATVGGLVQLVDAMAAFGGSLVVALAEVTGKSREAMMAYLRDQQASMPGLD